MGTRVYDETAMWWRSVLALASLVVLAGLGPLAHATPPDPTYIPGLYDDADYDDVVLLVLSTVGALDSVPPVVMWVGPPVIEVHLHGPSSPLSAPEFAPTLTRGPPAA
jgi:hypothetical protein